MPQPDLEAAIRDLVADAVQAALVPHLKMLDKLAAFVPEQPRRGNGLPPTAAAAASAAVAPARRRPRYVRGIQAKAIKAAQKLQVGQGVSYRQGRGTFDATIVGIDYPRGVVRIERAKDGKLVERPAHKLTAAAARRNEVVPLLATPTPEFSVGDLVTYHRGTHAFGGQVVGVDAAAEVVTIARLDNGRRVQRSAYDVVAADVAEPSTPVDADAAAAVPSRPKSASTRRADGEFKVGQVVGYRKTRSTRVGRIVEIHDGIATIEPAEGGTNVERPLAKLKVLGDSVAVPAPINLDEGQTVLYRQGRGACKARVVAVEHTTGTVLLRREDGKEVLRPASKLQPTEAA